MNTNQTIAAGLVLAAGKQINTKNGPIKPHELVQFFRRLLNGESVPMWGLRFGSGAKGWWSKELILKVINPKIERLGYCIILTGRGWADTQCQLERRFSLWPREE